MRAPISLQPGAGAARAAEAGLLVMVAVWAVNFSFIKVALEEIPPFAFNALRFPLAALLLAAVLKSRGRLRLPDPPDRGRVVALGVIGNVLYQLLFIAGMDRSRAGNASLLLTGSPVYTALLSAALGHERVRALAWVGIAATVSGIALVVGSGEGGFRFGTATLAGDLMLIAASAVWAFYTVGARDLIRKYGSVAVTAWTLWVGAALLFVIGVPDLIRLERTPSPLAWGGVAYGGVFGIGVAYLLWYRGVRVLGNTHTSAFSNLTPVLAVLVAWAWLGEVPNVWQVLGAVVIIGGISIVRRSTEAA
ncbi:MAG TPA: DMT family transporter [Longimicrobiales bacterium]|nr:DMT family transporter [Longimicrobiales bacterium]